MKNLTNGSEITCSKKAIVNSFYLMHKVLSGPFKAIFLSHFRMKNEKFGQTNGYGYEANKF